MRWRMGSSARGGRLADVPHIRAKGSGAEMRMDAAGGGGKGQLKGTIQDCSIEVGRCLRLSPLMAQCALSHARACFQGDESLASLLRPPIRHGVARVDGEVQDGGCQQGLIDTHSSWNIRAMSYRP